MSPEQRGGQITDKRSDIWAFGAVLYEMLTEVHATRRGSDGEIDWSRLPPDTPDALQRLIARCLEHNPRQRLRDIGEARVMLEGTRPIRPGYDEPDGSVAG